MIPTGERERERGGEKGDGERKRRATRAATSGTGVHGPFFVRPIDFPFGTASALEAPNVGVSFPTTD